MIKIVNGFDQTIRIRGKRFFQKISFSSNKLLYTNSFWLLSADFLNKVMMFLLTIIFARYLGVEGYGQLTFATSLTGMLFIFADFGISTLAVKDISRSKIMAKKYLNNIVLLKIIHSIITLLALYIILLYMGKPFSIDLMVYMFGFYILISSAGEFFSSVYKAYEKMRYVAISIFIRGCILFTLGSIFVLLDYGIYFIIVAYIVGALSSLIFLIYYLKKKITKFSLEFDLRFTIDLIKRASPFAFSLAFSSIYLSIDSILISHFIGDTELGYYSLGYSMTIVFYTIPAIISNVYFPRLSIYFDSDKLNLKFLFKSLVIKLSVIVIPLVLLLYFLAPHIFLILYGDNFSNSIVVFKLLLLALLFKFYSFPYSYLLIAAEKQNIRLAIQGFTALFNLVTNIIFIPKYGIFGAAGTTIASELLLVTMYYYFGRKALVNLPKI